jgi:formylglycine-generating enzyme required for sulfatase activity
MNATDLAGRVFPDPFPPDCASAWGDDRFGLWFEIEVGGVVQRMRWIEPGTFWMGSLGDEPERFSDEGPRHLVKLTEGYWLADTACTQAFWEAVLGDNQSHFKSDPKLPVENVSWDNITEKFLPAVQREVPDLLAVPPTEAQWEYACRAGRASAFWFGDRLTKEQANFEARATVPVKARPANGWGLYQMHGNVWEWCEGSQRKYEAESVEDPPDGQDKGERVLRGGAWDSPARLARSAFRYQFRRDSRFDDCGFRFALRSIKPGQAR